MIKITTIFSTALCLANLAFAQSPVVKLDFNMSGRTEAEVLDPDFLPWVPIGSSSSVTQNGVTFKLSRPGGAGGDLRPDYYKVGVQSPYFARLVCDAVKIDGGDAGAQIQLEISGLSTGTHTLLTYHNGLSSDACAPLDIYVNGTRVVNDLAMPQRATETSKAAVNYLTFNATAGQKVTIRFQAETTSSAPVKNVYLCGMELNTPSFQKQAKSPSPVDKDEHVDISNSTTLKWVAASGITKHRVYFGTDESCVTNATTTSACYKGEVTGTSYAVSGLTNLNKYYWRIDEVASNGEVTKGNTWFFRPGHLAFPGAEGYGRMAVGGRGGRVVHVTNLKDDNNPGSLRYAVENETGPRTIVFDVGGVIELKGRLTQSDRFVTIAGQTAPGQGISIRKAPFGVTGYDGITRFIRVQVGYGITYDGMGMTGSDFSIMDHCSINFAIDEQFSSRGANNITLQKTFIAEALNVADHDKKEAGAAHGYAGTISGGTGSYHHNLLVHNEGRNFSLGDAIDGSSNFDSKIDLFNNVCYNYGGRTTDGQVHKANFVNNYYKKGPASRINTVFNMDLENYGIGTLQCYFSGNILQNQDGSYTCDGTNNNCGKVYNLRNGNPEPTWNIFPTSGPFFPSYATIHSAKDAYKVVLSDAGANQPYQTPREIRMINETKNGTTTYTGSKSGKKGLPDREGDVGGFDNFPTVSRASNWDSDMDGLPDFWEKMIGTNPNSGSGNFSDSNADPNNDGYTNLEDYLNWLADPHYFLNYGATQTIDLVAMFRGFGSSASYSVADVVGGNVSISGTKATFTPSGCGFASFTLKATESGFTMPRKVGVFTESNPAGSCIGTPANAAPTVSITAPANNLEVAIGTSVELKANAGDSDGTVTIVEFYNGTTLLGTSNASPYTFTWTNTTEGTHTITAVATDNKGSKTTSAAITIVVTAKPNDCAGVENGTATLDNCDRCIGGTTGKSACASTLETENEVCDNGKDFFEDKNAEFKGTGYINVENAIGSGIRFNINATNAGAKTLSFRYASGGTGDRAATIMVNGSAQIANQPFPPTGAFTTYKTLDITLQLNAGVNSIALVSNTADGLANIDQIGLVSADLSQASCNEVITGINGANEAASVRIYPNPSQNSFHIQTSRSADVVITNAEGKVLNTYSNVSELEFGQELQAGVYFAKVGNKVYKFIKY